MNTFSLTRRSCGFTLIELLVVIAIIGVLMGLLIVAAPKVIQSTRDDTVVGDPNMAAPARNNTLFFTLRSIPSGINQDHVANPRRIVYYEDRAAKVNARGVTRSGSFDHAPDGSKPPPDRESCLYDPWGRQYGIIIDTNGDDRIDLDGYYADFSGAQASGGRAPRWKVGAFSMGKDERLGTNGDRTYRRSGFETSDDLISWE